MRLYTDSPIIDAISDTLQKDYIENIKWDTSKAINTLVYT